MSPSRLPMHLTDGAIEVSIVRRFTTEICFISLKTSFHLRTQKFDCNANFLVLIFCGLLSTATVTQIYEIK